MRERRLFDTAAAVLALHLVDDGFVNPEPGTTAGDHFRTTLIPVVLLGLLALAHRRARPAVRAAIAFGLGVLTLIIGFGVHVAQAFMGPFGGDHWTGLLLVPAGAAFLTAAWLARRQAPRRSRKRRAVVAVVWVLALYFFVLPFGAGYVITHKPRAKAVNADLGATSIPVRLRTDDGLELAARYVPSRNRAAVLLLPGRAAHARMLIRHGYGVLLVDMREIEKARATRTRSAGIRRATQRPESPSCGTGPTSTGGESAVSGSPSAVRSCWTRPRPARR